MGLGRHTVRFGLWWVAVAAPVSAQTDAAASHPCDARSGSTARVCRAAYDAAVMMIPLGGLVVSGGNPSLSGPGGGHRFGDLVLTLRAEVASAPLPDATFSGSSDTVGLVKRLPLVVPSLDFRLGIFRKPLTMGAVSVDFLGSIQTIPKNGSDYVRFGPEVRSVGGLVLGFGYGLRIGFEPKEPMPTLSLNVARHDLPAFSYGDVLGGGNFAYTLDVSAINVRLLVGKRFGSFELTGGAGADLYHGNYSIVYRDQATGLPSPRADSSQSSMRILTLANGALLLGRVARLTFEGGFQIGKDDKLPTIFEGNNTRSGRFFGGVGIGFKL